MPAGRKAKLNWTRSLGQFTTTIEGKFHRLGTDKTDGSTLEIKDVQWVPSTLPPPLHGPAPI
jgi:hypothetical protein